MFLLVMRTMAPRLLLAALVMAGCVGVLSSEKGEGGAQVPHFCTSDVQTGDACVGQDICMWSEPFTGGRVPVTHTCRCEFDEYRCSSCPSNVTDPGAFCTAGDRCDFVTFEVCDCSCDSNGRWTCIGRDTRSSCFEGPFPPDPVIVDAAPIPF
jgi:hypothetical protein